MTDQIKGYDPEPFDPCQKGGGHEWLAFDRLRRLGILYDVLKCKKCRELSIGWIQIRKHIDKPI